MRAAAILVLALLFTPALVRAAAGDEPQVTDPTGDARLYTTSDVAGDALANCYATSATSKLCSVSSNPPGGVPAPKTPEAGGAPAPAVLDIVSVRFADDGATLMVDLALASLDDKFTTGLPGNEYLSYTVCWTVAESPCRDDVNLGVYHYNGSFALDSWADRYDGLCGKIGTCQFSPAVTVVPGTPGVIRWSLPRSALAPDVDAIREPMAYTNYNAHAPGLGYHSRPSQASGIQASGGTPRFVNSASDRTAAGRDFPLLPLRVTPEEATLADARKDVVSGRDDLDILNVTLLESEKTLTISTQAARVDAAPADHHFYTEIFLTTGASVVAGYDVANGARTTYSGACGADGCGPHPTASLRKAADVVVVPGSPGFVNVTFARSDLGNPGPGDRVSSLYVGLLLPTAIEDQTTSDATAQSFDNAQGDFLWEPPRVSFHLGAARAIGQGQSGVEISDPSGDEGAALNPLLAASNLAPFDIISLRASGDTPAVLRLELTVADLSNVAPPAPYQGVFYAAAVSTDRGAFMAGYYASDAKTGFFCAPDTAVLTHPAGDPKKVVWQEIRGLLSIARDRGQANGASTQGSIIFEMPYSCFGREAPGDLDLEGMAAATFLIRDSTSGAAPEQMDEAHSQGALHVEGAVIVDHSPWWEKPFGSDQFYNIAGIVVALATALTGAIAILRRRGALRRYLREIDEIVQRHAADARAREAALVDLHARLRHALLRGRVSESHFVIVEKRLDQHLGRTRTSALAEAFGDLPHRLLLALQSLLDDGVMDAEDWRLFRAQLHAEAHISPDAREAIEARVAAWVLERPTPP